MQLRAIHIPVSDIRQGIKFYSEVLNLPLKFQDGDRYAAFECGSITLALVSPEDAESEDIALAIKSRDLAGALDTLRKAGAELTSDPVTGSHEVRALVKDPSGRDLILYQPLET